MGFAFVLALVADVLGIAEYSAVIWLDDDASCYWWCIVLNDWFVYWDLIFFNDLHSDWNMSFGSVLLLIDERSD